MGFKLGSERGNYAVSGEIKTKMSFSRIPSGDNSIPGTPIISKKLGEGIMGEANNDGTIFITDKIDPNGQQAKEVIMHEMVHMTDMRIGKLGYTDDAIKWNGKVYSRKDGMINYEGKMLPEGSKEFPWEQMPWE